MIVLISSAEKDRSPLVLDLWQIHEVVVPLHWIDLLPFIVDADATTIFTTWT
jgi:hypothetical protein